MRSATEFLGDGIEPMNIHFVAGVAMLALTGIGFDTAARADPSYVRRPHGWFLLMPPLTHADPVTGVRYVNKTAPQTKWSAMVIRGHDGHDYDFANKDLCVTFMQICALTPSYCGGISDFVSSWIAESQCIPDDDRHTVTTQDWLSRWSDM